jgi:hypothetical protein
MNVKDRWCKRHALCAYRTYKKKHEEKKSLYMKFFVSFFKCSKHCASTKPREKKIPKKKTKQNMRKKVPEKKTDPFHHRDGCNEDE